MTRLKYSDDKKVRRHHRVVELLRQELISVIQREVKDPRLGNFTITEIELDPDMRVANVLVCRFMTGDEPKEPTKEQQDSLIHGLNSAAHFIYEKLKRRLAMKQIPSVRFAYDVRMSELSNIWNLVRRTQDQDELRGAANGV